MRTRSGFETLNDSPETSKPHENIRIGTTPAPDITIQTECRDQSSYISSVTPARVRERFIQLHVFDRKYKEPSWMHPNIGGGAVYLEAPTEEDRECTHDKVHNKKHQLKEWPSTAIGGNDILSSVLFTAGLTVAKCGYLAPVVQVVVVIVIYCFRWIFEEVVSTIPLNGGSYAAILNACSKKIAAAAAIFSILSYLATGVVCAVSACNYLNHLVHIPVVLCTIGLLFCFALLCVIGISESASVALIIFLLQVCTLTVLCIACFVYGTMHPSIFMENLKVPLPDESFWGHTFSGSVQNALFSGFAPALLSVTGFESTAQFVEEQAPGVFPKTLRNMWIISSFFNLAFSFLSLAVAPIEAILLESDVLLAHIANVSAGRWLEIVVSIQAFIVLAGAVLTSYVGIIGLVRQLASDRLLPRFLLRENAWRGTHHYVIFGYFGVASSLTLLLDGEITVLAGIFSFAFLGVMMSFVFACLVLKVNREHMIRAHTTSWTNLLFCGIMIMIGLISNAASDPNALGYASLYYGAFFSIVWLMLDRIAILKCLLYVTKQWKLFLLENRTTQSSGDHCQNTNRLTSVPCRSEQSTFVIGSVTIAKSIESIKKTPIILFCKTSNLPKLNQAISYVIRNEQTYCLRLVHIMSSDSCESDLQEDKTNYDPEFDDTVCLFDHIYPSIKIDFVSVHGRFEPILVQWIGEFMKIPTNLMLMRQPRSNESYGIAALGVRIILD
uniref:Amino AcidPolyamineOrganocation (APC) Family putati n=1 Tax=Albugo laibachii Nc14 TaxID=890382 RepID=F0W3X9_9STRA|nr:Amino AcidPolyamineOrganocation (APC) Family putati [Albugo laibachii Nc14]|eukprot:CCA15774.1 Amino AcidPolyamineOrganocation (APC) Family putati [Albugo laibachii Nc14]